MIRRTLLRCMLVGLFLVGLGLIGCSDDTQRVITGSGTGSIESLSTDTDWPISNDNYDYDGYPFSEEWPDDEVVNDLGTVDDRFDNDTPSRKPHDRD